MGSDRLLDPVQRVAEMNLPVNIPVHILRQLVKANAWFVEEYDEPMVVDHVRGDSFKVHGGGEDYEITMKRIPRDGKPDCEFNGCTNPANLHLLKFGGMQFCTDHYREIYDISQRKMERTAQAEADAFWSRAKGELP